MDEITVAIGLSAAFITLYRLWVLYKRSTQISKNSLFLGAIWIVLCVEAIDKLTIDWLYNYLGRIYYNRLIGILIDSIFIGAAFRKTEKKFTPKERLVSKLRLVYCLAIFSWYFMYYLCK